MNLKLFVATSAADLEQQIQLFLADQKQEAAGTMAPTLAQYSTSTKEVDFITIHHLFQTMQMVVASNVVGMQGQQQAQHQLCVFLFYTLK